VWLLDLGNTRLKLARADASGLGPVTALAHGDAGFDDALRDVLGQGAPGEAAWLASVAPEALRLRVEAALEASGQRPRRAATRAECAGVRIAYADPGRLGVDRFLALLAARDLGGDQLVVSFGSAITVDLLDARGIHHGGLIGRISADIGFGELKKALGEVGEHAFLHQNAAHGGAALAAVSEAALAGQLRGQVCFSFANGIQDLGVLVPNISRLLIFNQHLPHRALCVG
jgi:type III pantothenate kinase